MKFKKTHVTNMFWIFPGILAFLIALIPTLTYQWPLSYDILFHIHVAQVYSQYGLTFVDPLIDSGTASKIAYPPLFSILIALLGNGLNIDYFQISRFLQPFLTMFVVLSVSYVAKQFYGKIAGISAGFIILSSYLLSRLVLPIPENLALIFAPLVIYFYYRSIKDKMYKYALISGLMFLLVILTHQATTLILFLIITSYTVITGLLRRQLRFFKCYATFIILPIVLALSLFVGIWLWAPEFINNLLSSVLTQGLSGLSASTGFMVSLTSNEPLDNFKYLLNFGPIILIFALIGGIIALKNRTNKDILLLVWVIIVFLISKAYWFGINVYSFRLLVHLLLPLSILGGFGLSYVYNDFKKREFQSKSIRTSFLILIFILSVAYGITTVENPKLSIFGYNTKEMGIIQIAPPSDSDIDLANWFNKNGDKKSIVMSNNYYTSQFLLTRTGQPIASLLSSEHCILWGFKKSELASKNVGYFIFDKRLTFSESDSKRISYGGVIFLNNKTNNPSNILQGYSVLVYENQNFMVFKIID